MKKYYITTAIPYANAAPHIGTAMDYLYGDILLRYQTEILDNSALMSIGTDEHGTKIEQKAKEQNVAPQELVDSLQPEFVKMRKSLNIDIDHTINVRTTDPDHVRRVQEIWRRLDAAGVIYKSTYEGWYCSGCEAFLTETEAKAIDYKCPDHNKPLDKLSEENYYLKVSQFTDQLREFATNNIVPAWRGKELLELIKNGAQDVSISRPKEKLAWGVPVPGDDSQIMYVWVDALSNYITVLGYPESPTCHPGGGEMTHESLLSMSHEPEEAKPILVSGSPGDLAGIPDQARNDKVSFWPANVQIVGKDILRFHAIIWPSILLALGLELPKKLFVHGFINVGGSKMSKSLGNVVSPIEIVENYGADAFRYYFSRHIPTFDDGDFTWEKFETAYNGELANDLGNLVSRVANMIRKYRGGALTPGDVHDDDIFPDMAKLEPNDSVDIGGAIDAIWGGVQNLNKYVDESKPWEVAKSGDDARLSEILDHLSGGIILVAEYLHPFLPDTSDKIRGIFSGDKLPDEIPILFPKKYLHTPEPARK